MRTSFTYGEPTPLTSAIFDGRCAALHTILPRNAQSVALIGVPSLSPAAPVPGGYCVSDAAPGDAAPAVWPTSAQDDILAVASGPLARLDARALKALDRDIAYQAIVAADEQRLRLVRYFLDRRKCDCVFAVLPGPAAAAHLFWRDWDTKHRLHTPDNEWKSALRDYYQWVDGRIGELRQALDGESALIVCSVYAVQRREGTIFLNEWLLDKGYLVLRSTQQQTAPFAAQDVDWSKTRCWSMGVSGRIYVNLAGREEHGIVPASGYDDVLGEIMDRLPTICDDAGQRLPVDVLRRDEAQFGDYAHLGPDLIATFGQAQWMAVDAIRPHGGDVATPVQPQESEAFLPFGYVCASGSGVIGRGELRGASVLSLAPTVLGLLGIGPDEKMEERSLLALGGQATQAAEPAKGSEVSVRSRLDLLGY
jgi:predicted AlkP superfamily phosphohydrolase/phosphomutase